MRFGIFIPQGWRHDLVDIEPTDQWRVMCALAQRADAAAWESLWVYDHFHTVPVPTDEATHEAWTLMSAFGAATDRIRLGQMCTCMGYRNPAYLAKVAATVDHVSAGRTEMGIGGGWYEHEWTAYGYGFPRIGERLGMLREGVEIMRQAWTTGTATLAGKHYQVDGAIVRPLPVQDGGIPMWIAGSGEKVTLRIAAEYASYTNFAGSLEEFDHKDAVLRGHCDDIGRDQAEIVRSSNFNTIVGETEAEASRRRRRPRAAVHRRRTCRRARAGVSRVARLRHGRAGGRAPRRARAARSRLCHPLLPRGRLRHLRHGPLRAPRHPVPRLTRSAGG